MRKTTRIPKHTKVFLLPNSFFLSLIPTSVLMSHERSGSKSFCILVLTCSFVEFYQILRYILGVLGLRILKKKIFLVKFPISNILFNDAQNVINNYH